MMDGKSKWIEDRGFSGQKWEEEDGFFAIMRQLKPEWICRWNAIGLEKHLSYL